MDYFYKIRDMHNLLLYLILPLIFNSFETNFQTSNGCEIANLQGLHFSTIMDKYYTAIVYEDWEGFENDEINLFCTKTIKSQYCKSSIKLEVKYYTNTVDTYLSTYLLPIIIDLPPPAI